MGWVVNVTLRRVYPLGRPGTHCIGGLVGPRLVWTSAENLAATGTWSPDCSARSKSLYRLSYHGPPFSILIEHNFKIWISLISLALVVNFLCILDTVREDNIKMDLQQVGCEDTEWTMWFRIGTWRTLVNAVMNLQVQKNAGNFLINWEPISLSRRTLLHEVSKHNWHCVLGLMISVTVSKVPYLDEKFMRVSERFAKYKAF